MENFGWFDGVVFAIIFISGIIAFYRGFIRESLGLASWIIAAVAGLYGFSLISPFYAKVISNPLIADIVAGITIALLALIICILLTGKINRKVRESSLSGLDRVLGFIFGLARGGLIVILLYILCLVISPAETQRFEIGNSNISMTYISESIEYSKSLLPEDIAKDLSAKQEEAKKAVTEKEGLKKNKESSKGDEIFEKLNTPKPTADKNKSKDKEGYNDKERDNLNELIDTLESVSDNTDTVNNATDKTTDTQKEKQSDIDTKAQSSAVPPAKVGEEGLKK